ASRFNYRENHVHCHPARDFFNSLLEPKDGYLFIAPMVGKLGIRDAVKKLRNNVSDEVVKDTNVDPSHGAVQDSGQVR
ncbi:hypothetical protein, partial [Bradyrhizobium zhanjiangense]|uniref:hypothetical protein n=1 Tax=Bradyrhizobium zhanjiangense TaxID=1325107 RepID=UPI001FDF694D